MIAINQFLSILINYIFIINTNFLLELVAKTI